MIVDLRTFKQKGMSSGDFNFAYHPSDEILPTPDAKFSPDGVIISGTFDIDGRDVYFKGKIEFTVLGRCARCLDDCSQVVTLEFDEKFVTFKDEECYSYSRDVVDLTTMVNDLILSNAPLVIYCKEDCKGLCPSCGKNLNDGDCGCANNF